MHSTRSGKWTIAMAIVTAGTVLAGCQKSQYAGTDTTAAAGEVARADSMADTTRSANATPTTTADNGWTDAQILAYTNAANSGEIEQGRLAARKATNPAVKAFARQMVTDHGAMLRECKAYEKTNTITPDTTKSDVMDLMKDSRDVVSDLTSKAAGKDWDGAYMDKQIDEHKAVLDKLQDLEKSTTNTTLKDMLTKAVGKVQSHLTKAQDIKSNQLKA